MEQLAEPNFMYLCVDIDANHYSPILRDIQHITFENMTYLDVWGNRLESIEGLYRMRMPQLRILHICILGLIKGKI